MNQFLSRRTFILIPTMSILKKIFNPMQVLASSLPSKEEWNLSKDEWKAFHSSFDKFHSSLEGSEDANTCMGLKIFFKIDMVGIRIKVLLDRN